MPFHVAKLLEQPLMVRRTVIMRTKTERFLDTFTVLYNGTGNNDENH